MASVHHVNVAETVGAVTITVRGKSSCHVSELRRLATLLGEVMNDLALDGEYTVIPQRQTLPGSSSQKGLSIDGTSHNVVGIAFQPGGNATRARYNLHVADAQQMFRKLKDYIGTSYNGKEKPKSPERVQPESFVSDADVVETPQLTADPSVEKSTQAPEVYYTSDSEWMETFVLYLLELADTKLDKCVSRDDLFDLIVAHTHYKNRFGVGPIFSTLKSRGYLVEVEEQANTYQVVGTPEVALKKKPKVASKKTSATVSAPAMVVKVEPKTAKVTPATEPRQQKYLSDEEWMRSFVQGLRSLVHDSDGVISRTDLHRFIKERTNQKKIAGTVYTIVDGLKLRGIILSAGEALYRFTYSPPEDIVEKAVGSIERARAETSKVFDGFAKFRMPDFAEGMFQNAQILRDFLSLVDVQGAASVLLKQKLAEWYPVSDWSHIQLLNYMVGQGYLVRSGGGKRTVYKLGPKGYERLGLPIPRAAASAKQIKPPASLHADMVKRSDAQALEPVAPEAEPIMAGFLPSVPAPAAPNQVLLGLAKLATEGQTVAGLIAEARDRIAVKRARKTAALAAIAQKPNIDDLVTQRLLAEIDKL